jgi:predicted MFS family arabinose efflux permease
MLSLMGGLRTRLQESTHAFRAVAQNSELRKLQLAFVGSITGEWGFLVAIAVYANDKGGASAVSLVLVLRWAAAALTASWLAYFADRYRRERVMLAADVSRAIAMGVMAVAAFADWAPAIVYGLATFMAVASKTFRPAQAALLPRLAKTPEELTAANVSSTAIESVGSFAGPALGGLLLAAASVGWVFVADALTLVWSAQLVLRIRSQEPEERRVREHEAVLPEMLAGFKALGAERDARLVVFLYWCQTFVAGALRVLIVVTALDLLKIGNSGLGFLNAAIGVGGLVGVGVAFALVGRKRLANDFGFGLVLIGAGLGLVGVWPTKIGALLLMAVFGLGNTLVDVSGVTLMQRAVRDEVLGRVFGALESLLVAGLALGALATPPLIDAIGTRASLIVFGAVLPVLTILLWARLRGIDARAQIPFRRIDLLRSNPIFAPLSPATLEHLATKLGERRVPPGTVVVQQGDPGDLFYIVEDGRVRVEIDGEQVNDLWPGEAFGEIALLRDVPRTATIMTIEETTLLSLERDEFIAAVTGHATSRDAADSVIAQRLGSLSGVAPV